MCAKVLPCHIPSFIFPGAIVYDSDPGTGGGVVSLDVTGTLTIGTFFFLTYFPINFACFLFSFEDLFYGLVD